MIDQTPYIGSRPVPLSADQARLDRRADAALELLAWLVAAAIVFGPLAWWWLR